MPNIDPTLIQPIEKLADDLDRQADRCLVLAGDVADSDRKLTLIHGSMDLRGHAMVLRGYVRELNKGDAA